MNALRLLACCATARALSAVAPPPTPTARRAEPSRIEQTQNYVDASAASARFATDLRCAPAAKKRVAVVGGGLSGLACAKYLSDAGG